MADEPEPVIRYRQVLDADGEINPDIIERIVGDVSSFIPNDPANRDWRAYQAWLVEGNEPEPPEEPPPPPPPEIISHRQFFQALAESGLITRDEALAAVQTGTIPPEMQRFLDTLSPDEQFNAKMIIAGAGQFDLNHPLTKKFAEFQGMSQEQVDNLWRLGASL